MSAWDRAFKASALCGTLAFLWLFRTEFICCISFPSWTVYQSFIVNKIEKRMSEFNGMNLLLVFSVSCRITGISIYHCLKRQRNWNLWERKLTKVSGDFLKLAQGCTSICWQEGLLIGCQLNQKRPNWTWYLNYAYPHHIPIIYIMKYDSLKGLSICSFI